MIKNSQEKFWIGNFGKKYIFRNKSKIILKNNEYLFKNILEKKNFSSIIEFGSNIGNNINVLSKIVKKPKKITAVEINKKACEILKKKFPTIEVLNESVNKFIVKKKYELVLSKGFLIHVNPKQLPTVYKKIYNSCKKYILICEYYSTKPRKEDYRRHKNKLFKRDFAGELLDRYKKLRLVKYGFVYHKDKFPQDDITWFLLKKN